jgi:hypothetical protein
MRDSPCSRKTNIVLLETTLFDAAGIEIKQGAGMSPRHPVQIPTSGPRKKVLSFQTELYFLVGDEGFEPPTPSV